MVINDLAHALCHMGSLARGRGHLKEALSFLQEALCVLPSHAEAHYELGALFCQQERFTEGLMHYRLATHFNPMHAGAYNDMALLHKIAGQLDQCVQCFHQALKCSPRNVETLNNLGVLYTIQGQYEEAFQFFQKAININPLFADAYNNLGVLYRDAGRVKDAILSYNKALSLEPMSPVAAPNKLMAMNYLAEYSVQAIYEEHRVWGKEAVRSVKQHSCWPCCRDLSPSKRLTIGYVSADLFMHSVSYFAEAPLRNHTFRVVCYSNVETPDSKTDMFQALGHTWRDIRNMSSTEVCRMVMQDEVDILVDLSGHTGNNRLDVFAQRPAPVQVTWIGYPNTTGLPTVQYRLTDAIVDPPETKQPYVEQLWRLPSCFLCYTPIASPPMITEAPCVKNGFITFGTFNNVAKMTHRVLATWSRIVLSVPRSRLLLKSKTFASELVCDRFLSILESMGLSRHRVDLLPLIPDCKDHLSAYSYLDISLDTFPYAGTTTTCECLLMGVPVITLVGDSNHAHSVGHSLLKTINRPEWVAFSEEEFVERAVQLSQDLDALNLLRQDTRSRFLESDLCNAPKFVAGLEEAFQQMWTRFVEDDEGAREPPLPREDSDMESSCHESRADTPAPPAAVDPLEGAWTGKDICPQGQGKEDQEP